MKESEEDLRIRTTGGCWSESYSCSSQSQVDRRPLVLTRDGMQAKQGITLHITFVKKDDWCSGHDGASSCAGTCSRSGTGGCSGRRSLVKQLVQSASQT